MIESRDRRSSRPRTEISTPSIRTLPPASSTNLNNATPREDLPEPVLPTTPKKIRGKGEIMKINHWIKSNSEVPSKNIYLLQQEDGGRWEKEGVERKRNG